ncbi:MAG: hypothetical protein KDA37_12680, partial [Planctomycetales bacterium]|nr:hypothetical protein [Planctomycetales bacterium]
KHVRWEAMSYFAEGKPGVDLMKVRAALDQFASGAKGLELSVFQDVARTGERLFDLSLLATVPDPNKYVEANLKQLIPQFEKHPELGSHRASYAVEQWLNFFSGVDGAEPMVRVVTARFGRPNLHVQVTEELLNHTTTRPVSEVRPVKQCILGTSVSGTGDTQGWLNVSLMPSVGSARLLFQMSGDTYSSTVGVNGPARIRSAGTTNFNGNKMVQLTRESFGTSPATFSAATQTQTKSVSSRVGGLVGMFVAPIARQRVAQQKRQAEAIASDLAERDLTDEFNRSVIEQVGIARGAFEHRVPLPFRRYRAEPRQLIFGTTSDDLSMEVLHAARGQLGAPDSPPPAPRRAMSLRLHQSGANNLAAMLLSGATLSQKKEDQPPKLSVVLPDWAKQLATRAQQRAATKPAKESKDDEEPEFKPWELTLRRGRPLSFEFVDGALEVSIHAAQLVSYDGDDRDTFDNWDIVVRFEPALVDGKWVLSRVGKIDALPTSFDPDEGKPLNSRYLPVRNNLIAVLNESVSREGLPQELPLRPIPLRDNRGELEAREVAAAGGWLTVGWDLVKYLGATGGVALTN